MRLKIALVIAFFCMSGCSSLWRQGTPIDTVRSSAEAMPAKTVAISISRKNFIAAVERGPSANKIRFVEVFKSAREGGGNGVPEYRLFDIIPGSVYDQVGLRAADILVAANGLVLYDTSRFAEYVVKYIPQLPDASIEIRRDGQALLLKYHMLD
ncbi:MAG: hypothetical protein K1X79_08235 [Oligoflexia bacterium]|nr:hypothetical protein [Oligoflexia bacterium]